MSRIHKENDVMMSRYQIENYLAEGGMQEVYKALDQRLKRIVIVKTPKNDSAYKRFDRSAHLSAKINHPNVAKTLDYFTENDRSYLVEEFIEGDDLGTRLEKEFYFLDPHLAAHVIHHLIKAVAIAHRFDIFHRDLKPSNIMVSNDPNLSHIKLTDFGIAKMTEEQINHDLENVEKSITTSKTIVGAIPYMSPELIQTPTKAGKPADIWAIGAILYYLMTGQYPFGSGLKAVSNIISTTFFPEKISFFEKAQFKGLCGQLWAIIEMCLQKEPTQRPTANELVSKFSKVCYSISKRQAGKIKNFIDDKNRRGFISCENGDDVFFHTDSFYSDRPPSTKMKVNFAKFSGQPQCRAHPVLPVK